MNNPILRTDSYKLTHAAMMDPEVEYIWSYFESRKGAKHSTTTWAGLQALVQKYFTQRITYDMINEAEQLVNSHMGGNVFDRKPWEKVIKDWGGLLPIHILALPEGTVAPTGTVLMV